MQLSLGDNIRALRRQNGQTQEALAEILGITSQAISRWESGGSYPDMELIPAIAHAFGVTIDELFGYASQREQKINDFLSRIQALLRQNNGKDACMDECIALARSALLEFPGNDRLMLALASALYTAGYIRHGEHHVMDAEGYSVYDTQRHRTYAEWREAIMLYEKTLPLLSDGALRRQATNELAQLYLNMGESEKALALAQFAPDIRGTKEFLRIQACDGKQRVRAYSEALLTSVHASATLMVQSTMTSGSHMSTGEKIQSLSGAIQLFASVCTDGQCGIHHAFIGTIYMLLSLYLWQDERHDAAFEALDQALDHFLRYRAVCLQSIPYTAPLLRLIPGDDMPEDARNATQLNQIIAALPEDWPWWHVPEEEQVRQDMQSDPRWQTWVDRVQAAAGQA